ncbi:MAG: hypothetical protein WA190_03185 [Usitatibacter sp.]
MTQEQWQVADREVGAAFDEMQRRFIEPRDTDEKCEAYNASVEKFHTLRERMAALL